MPVIGADWSSIVFRIKDSVDIVDIISEYIPLRKTGNNFVGLCPFHSEKTGSFSVNQDKQFFHCFGCGVSGDVIEFIKMQERIDFKDALAKLAYRAGIALPSFQDSFIGAIANINSDAADFFKQSLKQSNVPLEYLEKRGISRKSIDEFDIGYSTSLWNDLTQLLLKKYSKESLIKAGVSVIGKDSKIYDRFRSRIMIPIKNGKMIAGFGGRIITESDQAKYLNTAATEAFNKGKLLFGLEKAKDGILKSDYAVICEGYFDMIALYENGISNAVATLGTALSAFHISKIKRLTNKIYFCYDTDEAGLKAMIKLIPLLIKNEVVGKVVRLTSGDDPDSFIRKNGKELFLRKIEEAEDAFDFWIKSEKNGAVTVSEKSIIWKKITPVLNSVEDIRIREMLSERAGQLIGVPYTRAYYAKKGTEDQKHTDSEKAEKIILSLILSYRTFLDKIDKETASCLPARINRIVSILFENKDLELSEIMMMLDKDDSDVLCIAASEHSAVPVDSKKATDLFDECINYYKMMRNRMDRALLIKRIKSVAEQGKPVGDLLKEQQDIIKR